MKRIFLPLVLGAVFSAEAMEDPGQAALTVSYAGKGSPSREILDAIMHRNIYVSSTEEKERCLSRIKALVPLANLEECEELGNTPLGNAVGAGDFDVVEELLRYGANANVGNRKTGAIPLITVVWSLDEWKSHRRDYAHLYQINFGFRMRKICRLLLAHGADMDRKHNEKTIMDWARIYKVDDFFADLDKEILTDCAICSDEVSEKDPSFCELACSHIFHESCIGSWIHQKQRGDCPVCRSRF